MPTDHVRHHKGAGWDVGSEHLVRHLGTGSPLANDSVYKQLLIRSVVDRQSVGVRRIA